MYSVSGKRPLFTLYLLIVLGKGLGIKKKSDCNTKTIPGNGDAWGGHGTAGNGVECAPGRGLGCPAEATGAGRFGSFSPSPPPEPG